MKHTNMLFNNDDYYNKARRWSVSSLLILTLTLVVGVSLLQWRFRRLSTIHCYQQNLEKKYRCLAEDIQLHQAVKQDYAQVQQRHTALNAWKTYCFAVEFLELIAPLMSDEEPHSIKLTGQAYSAEQVFEYIELLQTQTLLASAKLESVHKNSSDTGVVFSIYLEKRC